MQGPQEECWRGPWNVALSDGSILSSFRLERWKERLSVFKEFILMAGLRLTLLFFSGRTWALPCGRNPLVAKNEKHYVLWDTLSNNPSLGADLPVVTFLLGQGRWVHFRRLCPGSRRHIVDHTCSLWATDGTEEREKCIANTLARSLF